VWLCNGYLMETGEKDNVEGRPDDKHSRKTYRRCESAGVVFTEWLVIGVVDKSRRPMLQQEWEDLSVSLRHGTTFCKITVTGCHKHTCISCHIDET